MQKRDIWNASLKTLVDSYGKHRFIDWSTILGINRVGGDVGNLWDINPIYDNDGTHLNTLGWQVVANEIYRFLNGGVE
jgi:hypothetical protein